MTMAMCSCALGVLVEHSLVRQEGLGGEPRFRMLETIRQFAAEQLAGSGEEPEVRTPSRLVIPRPGRTGDATHQLVGAEAMARSPRA